MTLPADIVTLNFFGGGEPTCFHIMLWRFDSGSKWCTHVSSCVTILLRKVLGSAGRWPRRPSLMSARDFFCCAVNIRGTQRGETFFIQKCSVIIRCPVLKLMPVVPAMCVMVKRLSLSVLGMISNRMILNRDFKSSVWFLILILNHSVLMISILILKSVCAWFMILNH